MKGLKTFYAQNRLTGTVLVLFPVLFVLSLVYGAAVAVLRFFTKAGILKSYRSSARVISVGNITLGGSGKTPLVEYLAGRLSGEGHRVVVLLRGYKRPVRTPASPLSDFHTLGDEAAMLKANLGEAVCVAAGPDRVGNARQMESRGGTDTMILDDGFQHWRFRRDLDIVTLDPDDPFGNGFLLPAGPLREEIASLKRADVFCLTRSDEAPEEKIERLESFLKRMNPGAQMLRAVHAPAGLYELAGERPLSLEALKEKEVCLLCGIANPGSFLRTVEGLSAKVVLKKYFEDHHFFEVREIEGLAADCRARGVRTVLTTQKDAVRLKGRTDGCAAGIEILVLKVALKIVKGREALDERLHTLYRS